MSFATWRKNLAHIGGNAWEDSSHGLIALLAKQVHKAWFYVGDLLGVLARSSWAQQVILITFLISALHAPRGWRKVQLGGTITWCGWTFHLDMECVHSAQAKLQ